MAFIKAILVLGFVENFFVWLNGRDRRDDGKTRQATETAYSSVNDDCWRLVAHPVCVLNIGLLHLVGSQSTFIDTSSRWRSMNALTRGVKSLLGGAGAARPISLASALVTRSAFHAGTCNGRSL